MSTLAVFLLLGGATALAASQLQKNSVGPRQLKKNAVTTPKIKNGAVTGSKVNLNSLGTVPNASHAATAGDAATLQGKAASAFVQGNGEVLARGAISRSGMTFSCCPSRGSDSSP